MSGKLLLPKSFAVSATSRVILAPTFTKMISEEETVRNLERETGLPLSALCVEFTNPVVSSVKNLSVYISVALM